MHEILVARACVFILALIGLLIFVTLPAAKNVTLCGQDKLKSER